MTRAFCWMLPILAACSSGATDVGSGGDGGPSTGDDAGSRNAEDSGSKGNADAGTTSGAPTELTLMAQTATSTTLTWKAPSDVSMPVDHYAIYRNGAAYATAKDTTYTDDHASNCEVVTLDSPATTYDYEVSAVDAAGNEGPHATQLVVWGYRGSDGGSKWGSGDYSYGLVSRDWNDTSGASPTGGTDVKLVFPNGNGGGFQPYSNEPQTPIYDLDIGAFRYLTFDIKAEHAANDFYVAVLSRLPFGDVYDWVDVRVKTYATLADDTWTTVNIPLADLHIGTTTFTGSIGAPYGTYDSAPYATLTVASLGASPNAGIDNGGFVLGTGLGGGVFIVGNDQNASVGTFHVQGPSITAATTVGSTSLSFQRTNMYKLNIGLNDGMPGGNVYLDNIGFTKE